MEQPKIQKKESLKSDKQMLDTISKKISKHEREEKRDKRFSSLRFLYNFGLVGWGIGVPVVIMGYIGYWLEQNYPIKYISWSLYFLLGGLLMGMVNVYRSIKKEQEKLNREEQF